MFGIVNFQGHNRDILLPTSMKRYSDLKNKMKQLHGILSRCYFEMCSVLKALANQVCFVLDAVIIYGN